MMKRQFNLYYTLGLILIILTSIKVHSQNILTNGGFGFGDSGTGFIVVNAGYNPATTPGTSVPGNYAFVTNPQSLKSSFISGDTIFMNLNWITLPFLRLTNFFKK